MSHIKYLGLMKPYLVSQAPVLSPRSPFSTLVFAAIIITASIYLLLTLPGMLLNALYILCHWICISDFIVKPVLKVEKGMEKEPRKA